MHSGIIQESIKVIETSNQREFEKEVNKYLSIGEWVILNSAMPIANLGKINEYTKYQIILVKVSNAVIM